jgi:hypothetical protein
MRFFIIIALCVGVMRASTKIKAATCSPSFQSMLCTITLSGVPVPGKMVMLERADGSTSTWNVEKQVMIINEPKDVKVVKAWYMGKATVVK